MRLLKPGGLVLVSFLLGSAVTRYYDTRHLADGRVPQPAKVSAEVQKAAEAAPSDFQHEPLWAYGFETPPKPGDTAAPQNPPTRNLRPNEDATEQTRLRHLVGSAAAYSLVDVRD